MVTEIASTTTQFPWTALVTALTGLSGALGGAYLANKFAEGRWKKQVSFEKEKERITVLRDKGEELHILVSKWGKATVNYQLYQLKVITGKLTEENMHSAMPELSLGDGVHDRLDALLYLYFPSLDKEMREIRKNLSSGHIIYDSVIRGELGRAQGFEQFDKSAANVDAAIERLKAGIRDIFQSLN